MKNPLLSATFVLLLACNHKKNGFIAKVAGVEVSSSDSSKATPLKIATVFTSGQILAQPQVPILCYHRLRAWKATDSRSMKDYIVPIENFKAQLRMLADSGYHTILPDQLLDYLRTGAALPSKPVMLTFDDSEEEHITIAAEEMKKYGFKGVFFLMTITMNRPGYLSKEQIRALSDNGHTIAAHSWDHHNVKKYQSPDWETQLGKPIRQIESITGKPVKYFAYPFGLWNKEAFPHIKQYGFEAAFQLSGKRDSIAPLYTIRRMIVPGAWDNTTLRKWMNANF